MKSVVLDASVALAWCFPDEQSPYADQVLQALEGRSVLVPAIWPLEIANGLLVGERRKPFSQTETVRFVDLLRHYQFRKCLCRSPLRLQESFRWLGNTDYLIMMCPT